MSHISFKSNTAKHKPNTLTNGEHSCPFCNREELKVHQTALKETDEFLIVNNKYPVLEDTFATVLIEHKSCEEHIGTYSLPYLTRLLTFAIDYHNELKDSGEFSSITLIKNHGIYSGGSIKHPHMQIVGFRNNEYSSSLNKDDFVGATIIQNDLIDWNISTMPRGEGYEFNLTLNDPTLTDVLAFYIQKTVQFIMDVVNTKYQCYNLAFYIENDSITVKILSRGPISVFLLGYGLHQTPDNLQALALQLKDFADSLPKPLLQAAERNKETRKSSR